MKLISNIARTLNRVLIAFGIDLRKLANALRGIPRYLSTARRLRGQQHLELQECSRRGAPYPQLVDWFAVSGVMSSVYFIQDLYFSSKIYRARPDEHLDVGSRIDGFVAQLAVFMPVDVMDIRPNDSTVSNIRFVVGDITKDTLPSSKQYKSVSSLHVIEHIGLGRYGDEIDVQGHRKALSGLRQRLCLGGILYLSVPVGRARLEFNAHRVFDASEFDKLLAESFELIDYALIDDEGRLHSCKPCDVTLHERLSFGCGMWTLRRVR